MSKRKNFTIEICFPIEFYFYNILFPYYILYRESPEVSEFKRELESPPKYDVHEENDLDNEKAIKNEIGQYF